MRLRRERQGLPCFIERESEGYVKCGRLERGILRVCGTDCHAEQLIASS